MSKKRTIEEVKDLVNKFEFEIVDKEFKYENDKQKIALRDKVGYLYFPKFNGLKSGKIPDKFNKSNPYSTQNIKLWCKLENKPYKLISNTYEGNIKLLKWKCLKDDCGEIFEMNWGNISQGKGCGFCGGRQVGLSNCLSTKNIKIASEWHFAKNRYLTPFDVTCGSHEEVWWQCSKNNKHVWKTEVYNRTNSNTGNGCPYCSGQLPSEDYNLLVINPKLCEEWNYKRNPKRPEEYTPNSGEYVWWTCKEVGCNHEWFTKITHRNNGSGCPQCLIGWGEKQLNIILDKYNFPITPQLRFEDCRDKNTLPFDVATFMDNTKTTIRIICEYDGEQHFKPVRFGDMSQERAEEKFKITQYHDLLKNNYCLKKKIPLLRIPYWERLNIEEILVDVFINGNMDSKYFVR